MSSNLSEYLGKRFLTRGSCAELKELRMTEISPSGKRAKVIGLNGVSYWVENVSVIEVLSDCTPSSVFGIDTDRFKNEIDALLKED